MATKDFSSLIGGRESPLIIGTVNGIMLIEGKLTAVIVDDHGGEDGRFTMDPDAGVRDDVPDWGNCREWFKPLYALGIRRVHFQTCLIGTYLATLNFGKRGADDDCLMVVTGWARQLWQYKEVGTTVTSDEYIFRGIPRCAALAYYVGGLASYVRLRCCNVFLFFL